ncbi:hypothetical protein DRQ36_08205 [bacterium]|mgnify:CR=1 FL=1|nr:MAG: hypothetical protein DRQ36_08205 [bacterium]
MKLVTVKELSRLLGIEDWRLSRWRRKGLIPCVRMGKTNYYNLESVKKVLKGREKLGNLPFYKTGFARLDDETN